MARRCSCPNDKPLAAGTRLVQPDLARTLHRIADQGAPGFYEGETAKLIADEMRRDGGIVTEQDLARYKPVWRDADANRPTAATRCSRCRRRHRAAWSVTETLNILENVPTRSRLRQR